MNIYEKITYLVLGSIALLLVYVGYVSAAVPTPPPRPFELVQSCTTESEESIVKEHGPGVNIHGVTLDAFMRNLAVVMDGNADAPQMDHLRAYTIGEITLLVAFRDQCSVGIARIPTRIFTSLFQSARNAQ